MKILNESLIKRFMKLTLGLIAVVAISSSSNAQGDPAKGEGLFKANCAACHFPDKNMTGPALKGARQRWIDNSSEENFYAWVKNSQSVIAAGDPYANQLFNDWGKSVMTAQAVNNDEIDHIFAYIEAYPLGGGDEPKQVAVTGPVEEETSSTFWWILGGVLLLVIGAVGGVRSQLQSLQRKQAGEVVEEDASVFQSARKWAWKNRGFVGIATVFTVILLLALGMKDLAQIGVFEDYKPEQPIAYSHELHAGEMGIDCKYCHNAVTKSKHATIPTVNVCMNCHRVVHEGQNEAGTAEIAKIHEAAGYDATTNSYSGETKPIKWVKVHNLPDHVYFNHSQHVEVGGIDCKQCHGNMKKETVGRVMTTEDLNNVGVTDEDYDENKVKFTKPTLTMGWCIECHRASSVDLASAPEGSYYNMIHERLLKDRTTYERYLEDDMVTVAELGGLECAKCHY